jgi:hypothetical protein
MPVVSISGVLRRSAGLFAVGIDFRLELPGMRKVDAEFHFAKVISIELMVGTEERIQV